MKYFSLMLIIALSICMLSSRDAAVLSKGRYYAGGAKANNAESINRFADSAKLSPAGEYTGKDSTFIKGRSASIGFMRCPVVKNMVGGAMVLVGYKSNKKGGSLKTEDRDLRFWSYSEQTNTKSIKLLTSGSEVHGHKIAISLSAVVIIDWQGKPWGAPTTVYGTYDTSNGKYSMQIYQYTPEDIK